VRAGYDDIGQSVPPGHLAILVRLTCEWLPVRGPSTTLVKGGDPAAGSPTATLLRLRPSHRPYHRQLHPLRVSTPTSGTVGFHGVTGGVYKARERIHRGVLIRDY
jgi:hypothetical protein